MNISIQANTRELENKLYLLAKEARVSPAQVIKEEARLVTENIIKLTPPKTNAQGRAAVNRDFSKAVGVLDQDSFARAKQETREAMRALIRKRDNIALEKALRAMDKRPWQVKPFAKSEHTDRRNAYGRVNRRSFVVTTDANAAKKYLRGVQRSVGWAKGAWVAALIATGGRAPNWYARHAAAAGFAVANFGENPSVSATARNVKIPNYQRMVDGAVRNRERVTQKKINRLIAGKATNLGFVTILER